MIVYGQQGAHDVMRRLQSRSEGNFEGIAASVNEILEDVKKRGDTALFQYAKRFENTDYDIAPLCVTDTEIEKAYAACTKLEIDALRLAVKRLRTYHEKQIESGYSVGGTGSYLQQIVRPIARVGIYAPGGTASYPSSVLMNAIPAKVAGVGEIYLATPAQNGAIRPLMLVAAREAGVDGVFRMGGAQAIAAFAYGTRTVPKVDKITGPGNRYVAAAKRAVFGLVGIDSIAGPSEVLILADRTANARYIAADMIAQAEHDADAAALCVTDSDELAHAVQAQLKKQKNGIKRQDIIDASLEKYGAIVVLNDIEACVDLVNRIAPEHLEIHAEAGMELVNRVQNAGGIFVGPYTPEALGDYVAGSNHVLPTNGTARFASPLGVYDFIKRMSVLAFDREGLNEVTDAIVSLAQAEGLYAHGKSASIRFDEEENE